MIDKIEDQYPEIVFNKAKGLDDAIIGVYEKIIEEGTFYCLVYSVKKCIEIIAKDMQPTKEEIKENGGASSKQRLKMEMAEDTFYYNTAGSYVGHQTPIWCDDTATDL